MTAAEAKFAALKALEDAFVLVCNEEGITEERRKAFDTYKATLKRALAPSPDPASQNEAATALRVSINRLVKETF